MPELPEVETTRNGLLPHVLSETIGLVTVHRRDLRQHVPESFERDIQGARIGDITRRSKYLLFHLQRGKKTAVIMLVHLGMSGSVRLENVGFNHKTHDHIIWGLGNGLQMVFHDPRRFGVVTLLRPQEIASHKLLAH